MSELDPCSFHNPIYRFDESTGEGDYVRDQGTPHARCMRCGLLRNHWGSTPEHPEHHGNCVNNSWAREMYWDLFPEEKELTDHEVYHVANAVSNLGLNWPFDGSIPKDRVKDTITDALESIKHNRCSDDPWEDLDVNTGKNKNDDDWDDDE